MHDFLTSIDGVSQLRMEDYLVFAAGHLLFLLVGRFRGRPMSNEFERCSTLIAVSLIVVAVVNASHTNFMELAKEAYISPIVAIAICSSMLWLVPETFWLRFRKNPRRR